MTPSASCRQPSSTPAASPREVEVPAEVQTFARGEWACAVVTDIGRVRTRLEDAWAVHFDLRLGDGRVHAAGVFDGMGGHPNGREAAQAAARHLDQAIVSSHDVGEVLERLNRPVRATRGGTTAVIALFSAEGPSGAGHLLSVGDSSAYVLDADGDVLRVNPHDSAGSGAITDFLGNPELTGHVAPIGLAPGAAILLCTDGVDGVLGARALLPALAASPSDAARELQRIAARVRAAGAPDNATVLWMGRTGP